MKKLNFRKTFFTFIILAALSPIAFTYQNFSRLDIDKESGLHDALASAIEVSDAEKKTQQQALNASSLKIVKKNTKKRMPAAIYDGNDLGAQETIVSESSLKEE